MTIRMRRHFCIWCGRGAGDPRFTMCDFAYGGTHVYRRNLHTVTPYGTPHMGRLAGQPLPEFADTELQGFNTARRIQNLPPLWFNHAGELWSEHVDY